MQGFKLGSDILDAVTRMDFTLDSSHTVTTLPQELGTLFDQSGKRFRPALAFLFAQVFDLSEQQVMPYARAVEVTHTASLVHDDVIDEALERRKVPTLNSRFTNTEAILAGDFLLAQVIGDLLPLGRNDIITDLTDAIKDLADGEWLQAKLKRDSRATRSELETVARKKTGSLMLWSCAAPAKLARRDAATVEACRRLGDDIGLFFQMLDDVNDFNPHSGKPYAADLKNGQVNFVTLELLQLKPSFQAEIAEIKSTGVFHPPSELEAARDRVVKSSKELEADLNRRFQLIAANKTHTHGVFEKMLTKVREQFSRKA